MKYGTVVIMYGIVKIFSGIFHLQEYLLSLLESGRAKEQGLVTRCYPYSGLLGWNVRDFGPLYIPAKGDTIFMTPKTKLVYRNLIEWEQKTKLQLRGDTVLLGDSAIWSYCFRENYYFVAGDKVLNSRDSRYWDCYRNRLL